MAETPRNISDIDNSSNTLIIDGDGEQTNSPKDNAVRQDNVTPIDESTPKANTILNKVLVSSNSQIPAPTIDPSFNIGEQSFSELSSTPNNLFSEDSGSSTISNSNQESRAQTVASTNFTSPLIIQDIGNDNIILPNDNGSSGSIFYIETTPITDDSTVSISTIDEEEITSSAVANPIAPLNDPIFLGPIANPKINLPKGTLKKLSEEDQENGLPWYIVNTSIDDSVSITAENTVRAVDDTFSTNEDTSINIINVLSNDIVNISSSGSGFGGFGFSFGPILSKDVVVNGSTVKLEILSNTTEKGGTIEFNADSTFRYTPATNFYGQDTFTYTISANGKTDTGTVTINVLPTTDTYTYESSDADGSTRTIEYFHIGNPPTEGSDILDLRDLLQNEESNPLSDYLTVTDNGAGNNVTLAIDSDRNGTTDLTLVLQNIGTGHVDLTTLINNNQILVDQIL